MSLGSCSGLIGLAVVPLFSFQCAAFGSKVEEWVKLLVDKPNPSENGGMVKDR